MADARILAALGLRDGAPDWAIAGRLRQLAGLPPDGPVEVGLWMRAFEAVDDAVRHGDETVDLAQFAHGIACHAIAPPGDRDEERLGVQAWDREFGVEGGESDELLRMLAIERLAPRLWNAGLVYIINYV
jgi:hypothetical protein